MAVDKTCQLLRASTKVLIPLVILGFGILALTLSFETDSKLASLISSVTGSKNQGSFEMAEEKAYSPSIELPHPFDVIVSTAIALDVDPALVLAVAGVESNYKVDAISHRGAIGVMQLMPSTAEELGVNPYILEENIQGGVMYLKKLLDKYGSVDLALAAYNAGMGIVNRYGGVPPFRETQNYVKNVLRRYGEYAALEQFALKS